MILISFRVNIPFPINLIWETFLKTFFCGFSKCVNRLPFRDSCSVKNYLVCVFIRESWLMANMHQFQADMLKIMCSQAAEVNNNEMQGIDGNSGVDCKSPREIPRTTLGENIETRRSRGARTALARPIILIK